GKVRLIVNGIATQRYRAAPPADAIPGLVKAPGELWLGTLAGLRAVKNLPRLVRVFATLPEGWRLVVVGEGPERAAILLEAERCGVRSRVHLAGYAADPARVVGLFDLFALSSDSEQFPISVVEAMAAGKAIAAPAVGDVATMVAEPNRRFIAAAGDESALGQVLRELAVDAPLRAGLGQANRAYAEAHYDETTMISAYRQTYAAAMGLQAFP
ncbi:glycosyltransferase, partial [Novosphingobium sp. 1949]